LLRVVDGLLEMSVDGVGRIGAHLSVGQDTLKVGFDGADSRARLRVGALG
jgi:hypothetical protein